VPSFTLNDLQRLVYDELDGNASFYPPTQVTIAINQILRRLNLLTGFNQAIISIPGFSVINKYLYDVPVGIVVPLEVYFEGRPLAPLSLKALTRRYRNWISDTTVNSGPVQHWTAIGIGKFLIHPADALGGQDIEVSGIAPTVPLVNADDTVSLNDEYVEILKDYTIQRVQFKEGPQAVAAAQAVYQEMAEKIGGMVAWSERIFPEQFVLRQEK
jgi:hypothetical protein